MRKQVALIGLAGGFALSFAAPALAAGPFSLSVSAGAQYDDNVTVSALDLSSHQSDKAAIIEGAAGFKFVDSKTTKLQANYDFYQSLHKELSHFDLQIHGLSLSGSHSLGGGVDVGAAYRFDHILLGASPFLDMQTVTPNISFSAGLLTLVTSYEYQHRNFKTLDTRDANHHALGVMAFFAPVSGTMLNAGFQVMRETAVGPEFDFWGHYFDAGVKVKVPLPLLDPTFRASYRFYQRDYSNITPSIGVKRNDKRHDLKASVSMPIIAGVFGKLEYEYIKSISNLPSMDYPENVVTFSLGWAL